MTSRTCSSVNDLVAASGDELDDDPELALLLAMQSVRETVDLGFATEEAVDAVHFALQELGVQYDVDPGTPVAVRSGPYGPVGVYALPPNELMELAESAVQRTLTDAECQAVPLRHVPGRRSTFPRTCRCAAGWTRMAHGRPRPRTRSRVRPSRSQRAT